MQGQKESKGFTLLEVLVAVIIIALVVTVVFELYWRGYRGIEKSETTLQAVVLGDSALEESLAHRVFGSVEEDAGKYFSLSVEQNQLEDSPLVLFTVSVRYKGNQKLKLISGGLFYEEQ